MLHQISYNENKSIFSLSMAVFVAIFAVLISYRAPVFPGEGLDPSWQAATHYAFLKQMTFGVDFAFTSGPLSLVYTNYFNTDYFVLAVFTMLSQAAALWAASWFARDRLLSIVLLCIGAILILPALPDAIYFTTAFAIFLLALNARAPRWIAQLLILTFAIPALAKFSFLLIGLALFGLADIALWAERRSVPRFTATFLLACFAGYWLAGQPPSAFPEFLINSLDVALGYSKAMSNFGVNVAVVALAGTVILCVVGYGIAALTASLDIRKGQFFRVVGFAGFMFVVFKSATVRQGHDPIAWQALILSVALLAGEMVDKRLARVAAIGTATAAILAAAFFLPPYTFGKSGYLTSRADALSSQIAAVGQLASPMNAIKAFKARNDEAQEMLAHAAPQGLVGSVGSVPWDFAEVIAAGYDFRPQPSLQSYSSYTSRLRQKDRNYFASLKRPDNLLFSLKSIDGRYPTMDLGPSLIEILSHYDPVGIWKTGLVLQNRTTPRQVEWSRTERISARIGEWANVTSLTSLSYLQASLQTRLVGQLVSLAFKQPHLWLDVRFSDGRMFSRRFIPQLAETGFTLVPFEVGAYELFRVAYGEDQDRARPVAIRLRPMNASASIAYVPDFEWEYKSFRLIGHPEHLFAIKERPVLSALLRAKAEKTAGHKSIPEGYFAHSGTRLLTEIKATGELRGSFGFLDSALKAGKPGPVRFSIRIKREDGSEATVFERILDPVTQSADRGRQAFVLSLQKEAHEPVRLVFETAPTTENAGWGWTYWGDDSAETH